MIKFGIRRLRTYPDEKLMLLFREGHASAFEIIYQRYSKPILHYFYRMFNGDEDNAQDFLQELFYKIINKKEIYDPSQKFSSWIYSIAANMCKNEYRRINNRKTAYTHIQESSNSKEHIMPEDQLCAKIMANTVWNELTDINESHKSVFILRFQNGYSLKEIAEIMSCSEGTVKSRLFYTVRKISKKFRESEKAL